VALPKKLRGEIEMPNRTINVDFSKKCGKIKPMNGISGGPRSGGYELRYDASEEFAEMHIPAVRAILPEGEYGFNQFLNIHCIFPNPNADEDCEESYNFLPTDQYMAAVKATGAEIFFRLGESAEPYSKKLFVYPPRDPEKWARICEHIIMHYNEGWANGYKYNIKNFEIWSSADSSAGFFGDAKEFYELYRIVANHLRERFPRIRIGGYGAGGFYSLNRISASEEQKGYIPFMQNFFNYITREETKAPLDFFTWACYTSNPDELALHVKYARSYLDAAGLKRTKSIVCEYNTSPRIDTPPALSPSFASELGASLILAQKSSLDMMMYSTSAVGARLNGLFTFDDNSAPHRYAAFNVMRAFGRLYRLGTAYEVGGDYRKELYALAAADKNEGAIMLVARGYSGKVEIALKDCPFTACSVIKTVPGGERGAGKIFRADRIAINGSKIILPVKENEIFEISLIDKREDPVPDALEEGQN